MNTGLALAIAAALLFGGFMFVLKRYFTQYPPSVYVLGINVFGLLWYLPIGFWAGGGSLGVASLSAEALWFAVGVSLVTVLARLSFFGAVAAGDVSYVAPLSKIVPAFVLPLEVLLLGQHLGPLQVVGVVVVTAAIYVANYEPNALLEPFRKAVRTRAAQLALVSAATFGVVDVGRRVLMQELAIPPQAYVVVLNGVMIVTMAPLAARHGYDAVRGDVWKFAALGMLVAVGNHLVMSAFTLLPASIVSPVVNTQAVLAVVLGGVLLGEDAFRVRLLAAGLAVGGVTLITVG